MFQKRRRNERLKDGIATIIAIFGSALKLAFPAVRCCIDRHYGNDAIHMPKPITATHMKGTAFANSHSTKFEFQSVKPISNKKTNTNNDGKQTLSEQPF